MVQLKVRDPKIQENINELFSKCVLNFQPNPVTKTALLQNETCT